MTDGMVFAVVLTVLMVLALAAFAFLIGPAIMDTFFESLDEWRELFEERKEKKAERKNK